MKININRKMGRFETTICLDINKKLLYKKSKIYNKLYRKTDKIYYFLLIKKLEKVIH